MSEAPKKKAPASQLHHTTRRAVEKAAAKPKVAGEKKRKDPNAPKGALTAYILFSNAKRDQVKKENPDIAFGQVAKEISALWKAVTPSEKKNFETAAAQDKKRYEKEMADYKSRGGAPDSDEKPAKKKKVVAKAASESEDGSEEEASDEE